MTTEMTQLDVVIVGAGAAGIGCARVLQDLGVQKFVVLERGEVGESFRRWPKEMRFISPSFPSNAFGHLDLNSIALGTSPAYSMDKEHLSGQDYAEYLRRVAFHFSIPVDTGVQVASVLKHPAADGFVVVTSKGSLYPRFVIWAAGEFQYPHNTPFTGAELCQHSATVRTWASVPGDEALVIGGYESGMDAAVNLVTLGKKVQVLDARESWKVDHGDPSIALSPYTKDRVRAVYGGTGLQFTGAQVVRVERTPDGYAAYDAEGACWHTAHPPILATGFSGSLQLVRHLFEWTGTGRVALSGVDESTKTPGLFVSGPTVHHDGITFCYIYRFRQRFAVIANAMAERAGWDTGPLASYRKHGMFLDDLSCCGEECVC